jgi:hypothetical protein
MGAQPGVPAAIPGPDAEAFLQVSDGRPEVGNGVDQMVDQHAVLTLHRYHI